MAERTQARGASSWGLTSDARRRVLWGLGLTMVGATGPMLASVLACSPSGPGSSRPVAAVKATPATIPEGPPPPPKGGLPWPALEPDWRPPSAVAGDVEALAAALAAHPRVGLAADPGLAEVGGHARLDSARLAALVGRLAPEAAVHQIAPDTGVLMERVVREDPPLIPQQGEGGRITWELPESLALDAGRLREWSELGDPAVLVVGPVGVDTPTWRSLTGGAVGSCEPLMTRLLDGQAQSVELLEPFLDHADAVLGALYLAELSEVVPDIEAELAEFEDAKIRKDFDDANAWERHQCGRRYREYLQPFSACVETGALAACEPAPRLFLSGAARVGSVEPTTYVPDDCPERLGRDYLEALREPARSAAEAAGDHLDARWLILAERLATLSEVHGALEQLCTPARRRFSTEDVEALQATVAGFGELYRSDEQPAHDARFLANDGSFRVTGLGMVRQLARYDAGTGSAARALIAGANELRRFGRDKAQCVARPGDPPLMTLLVDTAEAKPEFLGFFYAEELSCGELGPL